jgi:hypothetical protein
MPTSALGSSPIEFTSAAGSQLSIPISGMQFSGTVPSVSANWTPFTKYAPADQNVLKALMAYLAERQIIFPAAAASPKPAMTVTAADAGSAGNNVTVATKISAPSLDPTQVKFDVTVTETETYTSLTAATIQQVLGSDKAPGTSPGAVHVVDGTVKANDVPDPNVADYPLTGGGASAASTADVKNSGQVVFTLQAKKNGGDGDQTKATISHVDTGNKTFDLKVVFTKTKAGATLGTLQNDMAELGYEIAVSPPASGIFSVPTNGTITLSGGADGSSPKAATGTLFANQ